MGIIILLSVLLVISIALIVLGCVFWEWDLLQLLPITTLAIVAIALIICSISCICTQVSEDTYIYELEQDREALVESYNTYYNNYDKDLAHSQSLKEIRQEIADFNATINKNNKFSDNFFLNWFYVDCESIEPITISNGVAQ